MATAAVLACGLLALVAFAVVAAIRGDDQDDKTVDASKSTTTTRKSTSTTEGLELGAQQLIGLLKKGEKRTYHGRYETHAPGFDVLVEIWQQPPNARRDTTVNAQGSVTENREYKDESGLVGCQKRQPSSPWECQERPAGAESTDIFAQLTEKLAGLEVIGRAAGVGPFQGTCFAINGSTDLREVCVDANGIPLSIDTGTLQIILKVLDEQIPSEVFDKPAAVQEA